MVSGLTMKYSDPDEERHELQLTVVDNSSATQASDWLATLHKVKHICYCKRKVYMKYVIICL